MFGSSNQNDTTNQINNFGDDGSAPSASAPSLPTMGGSASPFSMPATPATDPYASPTASDPVSAPMPSMPDATHALPDHGTPDQPTMTPTPAMAPDGSTLTDIKQQALQQLSPLVAHLDQSAEEKFRTTMMMIQATDDQSLLNVAYDSAQKIEDDKARAQALLDVINEINYFTQQNK